MSDDPSDQENNILPPEKRIQQLSTLSSKIELNTNIAARKCDSTIISPSPNAFKSFSCFFLGITDQAEK